MVLEVGNKRTGIIFFLPYQRSNLGGFGKCPGIGSVYRKRTKGISIVIGSSKENVRRINKRRRVNCHPAFSFYRF